MVRVYMSLGLLFLGASLATDNRTILDKYLQNAFEKGLFEGSALVVHKGKVLLRKGYGLANREHGSKNTPQTKFRIGSITKQFAARAIVQLQEQGLLSFDDLVADYIEGFPKEITIHHLLTHTSGLSNYTDHEEFETLKMNHAASDKILELLMDKPLQFKPGTDWHYNNSGYLVLSYIIEIVSRKRYEEYMREYVLQDLQDTGFDHFNAVLKDRATGYQMVDSKVENADYIDLGSVAGAGEIYSTVDDLHKAIGLIKPVMRLPHVKAEEEQYHFPWIHS